MAVSPFWGTNKGSQDPGDPKSTRCPPVPEPLLPGRVPNLQLHRLAAHVDHLGAEFHPDRVVRVLLDCGAAAVRPKRGKTISFWLINPPRNLGNKVNKDFSGKPRQPQKNLPEPAPKSCGHQSEGGLGIKKCPFLGFLPQNARRGVLTFVLDELVEQAGLPRARAADHQELEEEIWGGKKLGGGVPQLNGRRSLAGRA